ncbi:MAG: ABC transporter permease [Clostridiales bacterium]|nr:ABC transporter permease [Clostridiales bacterium]
MFKYYLKKTLRNRGFLFWSLIFPLALMTFMKIAFGGLYDMQNSIDPMKAVIVDNGSGAFSENFISLMDQLSDKSGDNYYFDLTTYEDLDEAKASLEEKENEVLFEITDEDTINIYLMPGHSVTSSCVSKAVCDSYMRNYQFLMDAFTMDPEGARKILDNMADGISYTKEKENAFSSDPDSYSWYYYSTLVMGIFLSATSGVEIVSDLRADVSSEAMRLSVSSSNKSRMMINSFLARFIPSIVIVLIQLTVMHYAIGVSMGNEIGKLILFVISCIMFSLGFGVICGLLFKGSANTRGNKTTAVVMISVFLSGEMTSQLPGVFEKYFPIINDINPATLMNMAFYRFTVCGDEFGFYMNIGKITGLSVLFLLIGIFALRREKYASL